MDARGNNGKTALHLAARDGYVLVVEFLEKNGGQLEAVDDHENTPLHLAARQGHLSIVQEPIL